MSFVERIVSGPTAWKGATQAMLALALLLAACTPAEPRQVPPAETVQSRFPVVFPEAWRFSGDDAPVSAEHAVVVSTDSVASEIGARVMEEGGNAVDAAVAVSFALAVVNPQAGNIGGGGFLVVRMADGTAAALDYREKAPLEATRDMFLDDNGELTDKSVVGHLAAGVPGSVMGMWEAHRRFGTIPWADLVEPAAGLADGFEVHERFRENIVGSERGIRRFETTRSTFLPGGRIPNLGETFSGAGSRTWARHFPSPSLRPRCAASGTVAPTDSTGERPPT